MNLQELKTKVFEALGFASMCWIPKPSTEQFDSTLCESKGNELMDDINSFARSQTIEFDKWMKSDDCHYYYDREDFVYRYKFGNIIATREELYDFFLDHQKQQQEIKSNQ